MAGSADPPYRLAALKREVGQTEGVETEELAPPHRATPMLKAELGTVRSPHPDRDSGLFPGRRPSL